MDRDGRIEIEPAPVAVRLERRGRLLVAVPQEKIAPLTPECVEQTRARLLEDRSSNCHMSADKTGPDTLP
ncbi:MAG: hypothetical protein AABM33_12050 [Pseudomonadota bacterium]